MFQNPEGDSGTITLRRGTQVLFQQRLDNFRDLDQHFVAPVTATAGESITLSVTCENPTPGLHAAVLMSGFLRAAPAPTRVMRPSPRRLRRAASFIAALSLAAAGLIRGVDDRQRARPRRRAAAHHPESHDRLRRAASAGHHAARPQLVPGIRRRRHLRRALLRGAGGGRRHVPADAGPP
jgi:hypothetical protein